MSLSSPSRHAFCRPNHPTKPPTQRTSAMSLPKIASRDEWLAARKDLLAKEKDMTTQRDALNAERRNLPMVEIEKDYIFDGPNGPVHLIDIFEARPQLIIYHFM